MVDLLFGAARRGGLVRTDQLRRVMRRGVAAGGMLDSCELKSMTWVVQAFVAASYAVRGLALARRRAVEL
jgi:hypothetical protein